jgi:hypothetical protein
MGRIVILAALFSLMVAAGAPAQIREEPSDVSDMKVVKVDVQAALTYENMALASAKKGNSAKAREQLVNARGALNDMEDAMKELVPDEWWAWEYLKVNHKDDPWTKVSGKWFAATRDDFDAEYEVGSKLVKTLEEANAAKEAMLAIVTQEIHDRCLQLINLRGPIEVNGVPQGHSQLTVTLSCDDPIDVVDLGIQNVVWAQVDAGSATTTTADGGKVLEVDAHGAKSVTVTAETNPDAASGEKIEGDVVDIAGDSGPPIDEVM